MQRGRAGIIAFFLEQEKLGGLAKIPLRTWRALKAFMCSLSRAVWLAERESSGLCKGRSLALVLEHRLRRRWLPGVGTQDPQSHDEPWEPALLGPGWNLSSEPDSCIHLFERLCVWSFQGPSQAPQPGVPPSPHSQHTELNIPWGLGRHEEGWSQRVDPSKGPLPRPAPPAPPPPPPVNAPGMRRQQGALRAT